jgi:hypothetical protein
MMMARLRDRLATEIMVLIRTQQDVTTASMTSGLGATMRDYQAERERQRSIVVSLLQLIPGDITDDLPSVTEMDDQRRADE